VYQLLKPLLFCLDPETSHNLVMRTLSLASRSSLAGKTFEKLAVTRVLNCPVNTMGLEFPNPVGLAPGLDKQGNAANMLSRLGFGFVELGTVTPLPQPGNPRPRIFRLRQHNAIINRMGFNSVGLEKFLNNVAGTRPGIIKGINIGKNAATPMARATDDYLIGLRAVYQCAEYITINISSPNTKNLRELQNNDALNDLLKALHHQRLQLSDSTGVRKPLVLKIAPDINAHQINTIAHLARKYDIDGIAATNTTITRDGVEQHPLSAEPGGLSGTPLKDKSTAVVHALYRNLENEIPIIGIGGIEDADSAMEKFQAGAKLVQIYTGFIYRGPGLIREIITEYSHRYR
jgi:dihydroorotate dehydrogenase